MAVTLWDADGITDPLIAAGPGEQLAPAIADNGGTEFGVAWVDPAANTITVKFYDEQGLPSPRPTAVVTDGVYGNSVVPITATVADLSPSAPALVSRVLGFITVSSSLREVSFACVWGH